MNKKGNLVGAFIGMMVLIIIGVAVTLPVVQDTIDNSTVTGTAGTLLTYIPLLLVVVLLVAVVGMINFRGG